MAPRRRHHARVPGEHLVREVWIWLELVHGHAGRLEGIDQLAMLRASPGRGRRPRPRPEWLWRSSWSAASGSGLAGTPVRRAGRRPPSRRRSAVECSGSPVLVVTRVTYAAARAARAPQRPVRHRRPALRTGFSSPTATRSRGRPPLAGSREGRRLRERLLQPRSARAAAGRPDGGRLPRASAPTTTPTSCRPRCRPSRTTFAPPGTDMPRRQDALRRARSAARLRGAADDRHLPGRLRWTPTGSAARGIDWWFHDMGSPPTAGVAETTNQGWTATTIKPVIKSGLPGFLRLKLSASS